MSKLPGISGNECVKALEKAGFFFKRQEGNHIILRRDDPFTQVVVPRHKELDRGTLRAIYLSWGGSLDPEPDSQSPFDCEELQRAVPNCGRSGVHIIRRGGI